MIYDTWDHITRYKGLLPALDRVIGDMTGIDPASLPDGRTDFDGDRAYVNVQSNALRPASSTRWECHANYADLQLGLEGHETIGYAPTDSLPAWGEYKPDACFSESTEAGLPLPILPGHFAIFFPQDAHRPCQGEGRCRKAVFKLALND